ncbi:hypothetical protein AB0M02_11265 [Actinoplanes sp. NPDC051861]|uniref:hypothetical protein n=1 Tax=Actinoplanes sp. NPDC051861 TaxID=3155170 RepID=UPI0034234014
MPDHDDLIDDLRDLGRALRVPQALDQRNAVRARLTRPAPRRPRVRILLAAALAALVASVTLIAPARAAVVEVVGDLLRVAGIEVRREQPVGTLPLNPSALPSSRPGTLAEADRLAAFPVRVPAALGDPEKVLLSDPDPSGAPRVVTLLYRDGTVRLDQFDGRIEPAFFKMAPDAQWVDLGNGAVWLPEPHPVTYTGRDGVRRTETARLAGPTLIWASQDSLTYRLEGIGTLEEATEVARSLH